MNKKLQKSAYIAKAMLTYVLLFVVAAAIVVAVLRGAGVITSDINEVVDTVGQAIGKVPMMTWIAVGVVVFVMLLFPLVRKAVERGRSDGAFAFMFYGAVVLSTLVFAINQIDGDPLVWGLLAMAVLFGSLYVVAWRNTKVFDHFETDHVDYSEDEHRADDDQSKAEEVVPVEHEATLQDAEPALHAGQVANHSALGRIFVNQNMDHPLSQDMTVHN